MFYFIPDWGLFQMAKMMLLKAILQNILNVKAQIPCELIVQITSVMVNIIVMLNMHVFIYLFI